MGEPGVLDITLARCQEGAGGLWAVGPKGRDLYPILWEAWGAPESPHPLGSL